MKPKINLVMLLMTISAIFMLALQLYSNYLSYQSNERIFKTAVDGALKRSVTKLMNIRRDEFADQYKRWLLDTNLIDISCRFNGKETVFSLKDKKPTNRPPFTLSLPQLSKKATAITPKLKGEFVDYFVKNFLYDDFSTGRILFFTTSLGERQSKAFSEDRLDLNRLTKIYTEELNTEDINAPFKFKVKDYRFSKFNHIDKDSLGTDYITHSNLYGFGKQVSVNAIFANIAKASLAKMKWLIFSSLVLIGIIMMCFAYTLKTMFSQKKLAALKDDFVNNMTHELKTPIATISIAAEAIQDFETNKVAAQEYLSIIRSQASSMTNLIEQLLSSMLAEQSAIALNLEKISFREIIDYSLWQYQPQLQASNAVVVTAISEGTFTVKADKNHLRNVIANLIDNAIKYSEDSPEIKISLQREQQSLVFQISNRTAAIPELYLSRLFEKFFRVPTGNLHQVKGYGLGLSYVHHIVRQHGGKITASIHANIITFTLTLPIDELR